MATVRYSSGTHSNPYLDTLISGQAFSPSDTITYYLDPTGVTSWATEGSQQAYLAATQAWAAVANIKFAPTTNRYAATWVETLYSEPDDGTIAAHYYPNDQRLGGEWNVGHWLYTPENNAAGGENFITFLHELGHGLGLNHVFDEELPFPGVGPGDSTGIGDNGLAQGLYTVMGYLDRTEWVGNPPGTDSGFAATPMAFDIAAVQAIYGANTITARGDDVYTLPVSNSPGTSFICIWDTAGVDTISARGSSASTTIDLRAATLKNEWGGGGFASRGDYVVGGYTIASGVIIENVSGSKHRDVITGNAVANKISAGGGDDAIYAGAGDDTIDGGSGWDWMRGEQGNDSYFVESTRDHAVEERDAGSDHVTASLDHVLSDNIESLTLTGTMEIDGTGNELANSIQGSVGRNILAGLNGNDTLSGDAGDDTLDGGAGRDSLIGGAGDDLYLVDATTDVVVERASAGDDRIETSRSYALSTNLEHLKLTGTDDVSGRGNSNRNELRGNSGDNEIAGVGGDDRIYGGSGDDVIDGGSGADRMDGQRGDDVFIVDHGRDRVIEASGGGKDRVIATIDYMLPDHVETLRLDGGAITGTGNGLGNLIGGSDIANDLFGLGGNDTLNGSRGLDRLTGGTGADSFRFDERDTGRRTATADLILDFSHSERDRLDLSRIDAVAGGKDDAFRFIGKAAFHGVAGELRQSTSGSVTYVSMDVNGDKVVDIMIGIEGKPVLVAADFIL